MIVFIDFDDVLFDTASFKDAIKDIFLTAGLTDAQFQETYDRARVSGGVHVYSGDAHLEIVEHDFGIKKETLKKLIGDFLSDTSMFIFDDAVPFLEMIQKKGKICLVSFGASSWQNKKVLNSGIAHYFDDIQIGARNKGTAISQTGLQSEKPAFFIDDRVDFIDQVKEKHPHIHTILMTREQCRYNDSPSGTTDSTVCTLEQVLGIIQAQIDK